MWSLKRFAAHVRQASVYVFKVGEFAPKQYAVGGGFDQIWLPRWKTTQIVSRTILRFGKFNKNNDAQNLPRSYYCIAKSNLNIFKVQVMPKIGQIW